MQHLDISNSSQEATAQQAPDQLSTSPNSVLESVSTPTPDQAPDTPARHAPTQNQGSQHSRVPDDSHDWQRASSSHNAARKKKRKQQRRAVSHPEPAASAPTADGSADATLPPSTASSQTDQAVYAPSLGGEGQTAASAEAGGASAAAVTDMASPPAVTAQPDQSAASASCHESSDSDSDSDSVHSKEDLESESSASLCGESQAAESASRDSEADGEFLDEGESADEPAFQSSVASVTADFAMQNVILQIGLRLVAPDGMRIKQLSRWVLRCSACFKITKVSIPQNPKP